MPSRASTHPNTVPKATPKQTSLTRAVATGGRAALDQAALAASYGPTGQQQALKDTLNSLATTGTGYSSHPGQTSAYAQWQQAQGFRPQNYDVTFGQTPKGAYSGFKTEGELKAAILGSAELKREQEMAQADALKSEMQTRLGALGQQYDTGQATAGLGYVASVLGTLGKQVGKGPHRAPDTALTQQVSDVAGSKTQDFLGKLNDWYTQQGQPLVEGMQTANQISQTPTREYEMATGAGYGVDPNLLAGWFPMSSQISDAANQRDIQSLNDTGLPYAEQQSTIHGVQQDQTRATAQQAADQQLQLSNDIYGVTSFPGDQLAQAVDAPLEVVHDITTDPNFATAQQSVETAMADAEAAVPPNATDADRQNAIAAAADSAIKDAMAQVVQGGGDLTQAQVLERILRSLNNI